MKKSLVAASALFCLSALALTQGGPSPDEQAVRDAVLDYVESVYNAEPARMERALRQDVRKVGFYRGDKDADYRPITSMTYDELVHLAGTFKAAGRVPKDPPKEVTVYEVTDKTACAKVTAAWGMDYFHLAKFDGKWKIVNVLWQSPPKVAGK